MDEPGGLIQRPASDRQDAVFVAIEQINRTDQFAAVFVRAHLQREVPVIAFVAPPPVARWAFQLNRSPVFAAV